jgi:hypothetical protein
MEKIKEFIYSENPRLSRMENLKLKNRSNHNNELHQVLFNSIDEFVKIVVKDIQNIFHKELFDSNQLNIISDESTIQQIITSSLKSQGHHVTSLNNSEMIYRVFNFIKPTNLLPQYNQKLYLIKQLGISESGKQVNYVINPFFFGFKISFDIYITSLFCSESDETIEDGLIKILIDKYGEEFKDIYDYVAYTANKFASEGKRAGDQEDETFIAGIQTISGINSKKIFHNFIYESAMSTASERARILKGED